MNLCLIMKSLVDYSESVSILIPNLNRYSFIYLLWSLEMILSFKTPLMVDIMCDLIPLER